MSEGLEALERNRNFIERYFVKQLEEKGVYHKDMKDAMLNDLSIIEKELKRLYWLEKTTVTFSNIQQIMFELEKNKKALNTISQNFRLVGNCLHAKNKYAENGWVFVKELEDEEEHNTWKEVLK